MCCLTSSPAARFPTSPGSGQVPCRCWVPWSPSVKFPFRLTLPCVAQGSPFALPARRQDAAGSLASVAVTLRLLPSAGAGDAPTQATRSSLGRCLGTGHSLLPMSEMFRTAPLVCVFFNSLLPLRKIRRTFQRRDGRQQLTLVRLLP